jgi:OOP family OmpA-OmpF porin
MIRRVAIALSLAGLLACASSPPEVSPLNAGPVSPGPNERVNVSQVYVVVDSSSSIANDFQTQKALVRSFVGAMPDGSYDVAAVAFGGYKRQTEGLKPFNRQNLERGAANIEYLKEGTPLDRVLLELAPETVGQFGRGLVIVFSDGLPTDPVGREIDPDSVIAAAKTLKEAWEGELCFHTVHTGDDPQGAQFLKELSMATDCGSSRSMSSLQNVAALQNFEREIFFGRAPVVAAAPGDADGDGVADDLDECPGTPKGVLPDGRGCWTVPGLFFAFDKADIKDEYKNELGTIVRVLNENPGITLRLDGYTDSVGPEAYNMRLSERRADAVRNYLLSHGIDGSRVSTRGFGESRPAYSNDTAEGRAKNRRTEITAISSM